MNRADALQNEIAQISSLDTSDYSESEIVALHAEITHLEREREAEIEDNYGFYVDAAFREINRK